MELGKEFKVSYENARSKEPAIFRGSKYRITILSESLIRFEYSEDGKFENRPTYFAMFRNFEVPIMGVNQDNNFLVVTTKYFKMEYHKEKPFKGSRLAPDSNLKVLLLGTDKSWHFNHPEVRNFQGISNNVNDRFKNKGLYSTDGFTSIDDSESLVFEPEGALIKRDTKKIDTYLFIYKRDFGACLKDYYQLTGKPSLIRRSALGVWWNKNDIYDYQDIKQLIAKFNKYQIPVSNILLGNYWSKKDKSSKTGYEFDENYFSSPYELTNYMHERGVKLGLTINPEDGINPSLKVFDSIQKELGLVEKNVIAYNALNKELMPSYLEHLIKPLSNVGVDFVFFDYNPNNKDELLASNYYNYNYYRSDINRRGQILAYNGLMASHRYPVYYSGETTVDWRTLKYLPYYNSRSSNIGVSWWSHNIGGFKDGVEDSQLYMRYVQLGVFSPIFRFASKKGHYYKREPWLWDVKTRSIVTEYCQLRQKLIPYLYTEANKYYKFGLPLIQPLYYKYPHITDEPLYKNEYFFGTELFVSPITSKKDEIMNRVVHRVFIPNGMWYDFKTGKKFPGGKRYITFFKDEEYPVYAKSGSIIPLAGLENNKNVTKPPKSLEIHVFPGLNNTYKLYEDDGESSLYEEGYFIVTNIDYNYQTNNYTLIIRPIEGKSGIIPDKRDYKIRFRNTKEAEDVIVYVGENKANSNSYADDNDFIVEVKDVSTVKQLTINCKGKDIEIDAVRIVNDEIDSIISDLQIETRLKEKVASVIFSDLPIKKKRIAIRKLNKIGLDKIFIRMFLKLLEYVAEI